MVFAVRTDSSNKTNEKKIRKTKTSLSAVAMLSTILTKKKKKKKKNTKFIKICERPLVHNNNQRSPQCTLPNEVHIFGLVFQIMENSQRTRNVHKG